MEGKYNDILNLPHHKSDTRAKMPGSSRAAQFAPFAALSGFEDEITEAERQTEERIELDESRIEEIDRRLRFLFSLDQKPEVTIKYYEPDLKKEGGSYKTVIGVLVSYKETERLIKMADGTRIPVDDIVDVQGGAIPYFDSIIC